LRKTFSVLTTAIALLAVTSVAAAQSGPDTTPPIVAAAAKAAPTIATGPFEPSWESIEKNYQTPAWFRDAKFGIMMHWGLYAVPAHASEWYAKHMYSNGGVIKFHTDNFGPPDKFGYKVFIPKFAAEKWDPDAWAALFKRSGARYVIPTAIHHDGFALWESKVNPYNAKRMGPKRDLIGELAVAVRKQGLKFGVSHHGIEHFTFINPSKGLATDLDDPQWKNFYSVADRGDAACEKFLANWVAESVELIDQYQPDILWYDNGVNGRLFDPLKLKVAAHYYNRAANDWKKQVSISTKGHDSKEGPAYLAGSIMDFERSSRAPKDVTDYVWEVDEPVLRRFGYTTDPMTTKPADVIRLLIDCTSRNGTLLLNISPKADGTIPDEQQALLLEIGKWLDVNGEAIYGTRPWRAAGEGKVRFTTKDDTLHAIFVDWPGDQAVIPALAADKTPGEISEITLLGRDGKLTYSRDASGLKVTMPTDRPAANAGGVNAVALKIVGLKLK